MTTRKISMNDNIEQDFRKIIEGKWVKEEEQKQIAKRQISLGKNGMYLLKGWKFNREEAHAR